MNIPSPDSRLSPDDAVVALVSLEGPDPYAQAGGPAVKVTGLAETLASMGYDPPGGHPPRFDRLDLDDVHARAALEHGAMLAISTDAHAAAELGSCGGGWIRPGGGG